MNEIAIYTQPQRLAVKEYQGQRVITFRDVDTLYQRPEGTAGRNFRANRERFIEGEDYFRVCADEIRLHKILELSSKAHEDVIFLTKMGYLMLVKSFTDDLAWMVQRQLVKSYFEAHEPGLPQAMAPAPVHGEKKPLPRVRTIPKAAAEIREKDPHTMLTVTRLRRLVKIGVIPVAYTGKCPLVNMDTLEQYMAGQ